jgi:hypothetical protein
MTTQLLEQDYAPWSAWDPKEYLAEYYAEIMPDEKYAMEFLAEAMQRLPSVPLALDFGCGPTVHHLFPLVPQVQEIHLAEYLPANREEVSRWLRADEAAHDWRAFSLETLRLEGHPNPSGALAAEREWATRARVSRILPGDAGDDDPLGPEMRARYPLVTTHYCAEGATHSKAVWRCYMRNIAGLVQPGGTIIVSACGAADYYMVGRCRFPCAGIDGKDLLLCLLEDGFMDIDLRVRQVPDHSEQGYSSVIFASAVKAAGRAPV